MTGLSIILSNPVHDFFILILYNTAYILHDQLGSIANNSNHNVK